MPTHQNFIEKLLDAFDEFSDQKTIAKNQFLIREGQIEKNLFYIETGAVRVFRLTELEEQTIRFGCRGSLINSLYSFIKDSPSEFYIETIRKTTVKVMKKENLLKLAYGTRESLIQYVQLLEDLVTQQIEREIDLLTDSPSERLQRILKRSPNLFQEIPLKYIASYLRMSPETLSRIRNS
ncbi:MAG: Crp/Fnr family transcriptional regulator [Ginsengibacter sp.]